MGWKQKFEENPTIYIISWIVVSVAATFGAIQGLLNFSGRVVISTAELNLLRYDADKVSKELTECKGRLANAIEKDKVITTSLSTDLERRLEQERNRWIENENKLKVVLEEKEKKIIELQGKIQNQISASPSTNIEAAKSVQASSLPKASSKSSFENDIIRIEVVSFQRTGPYLKLLLKHINKTSQSILILAVEHERNTFLMDDQDRQFQYITPHSAGDRTAFAVSDGGTTSSAVELAPEIPKILAFYFHAPSSGDSSYFSFASKYRYGFGNNIPNDRFFIRINRIQGGQ